MATATLTTVFHHTGMSQFAGKAVDTQMRQSVDKDTTAKAAMTEGDDDKVLHAVRTAKSLLAQSGDMGIVSKRHCQSQTVLHHRCQRDDALPWQVGGILDTASTEVRTRSADAHRADALIATILFHQCDNFLRQSRYKLIDVRIIRRQKMVFCNNVPADINNGIGRFVHTHVHTYHTGLNLVFCLNNRSHDDLSCTRIFNFNNTFMPQI